MSARIDRLARDLAAKAAKLEVPTNIEERFSRYAADPVGFARDVLHVVDLPDYQQAVLRDVASEERVAWVAGHATGKSYGAAILIAWYLCTRPGSRCIVTSATYERQVGRVIFAKLKTLAARAKPPLPLVVSATRAQVVDHPEWSAEGVPSAKPENFAGFHSDRMLVIADESKALDRPVFEELQGVLASATVEARLLLLSTAGPATGYFFERFQRHADTWTLHRTPSTRSPFAVGFAERMREECLGESDPVYRMRVLAEFAEDVEGQLLKLSDIYAATGRVLEDDATAPITLGCDIARFGDDRSVVAVVRGQCLRELVVWRGLDTMATAERIATLINAHRAQQVFVDEVGVGGGPLDRLRQLGFAQVRGVNVGAAAFAPQTFANRRAELGWALRAKFERGEVAIPDDPGLVSELAALRYTYNAQAKIILEPKDQAKARLGRSPDLADAAMLALVGAGRARASKWGTTKVLVGGGHIRIVPMNRITPWGGVIENGLQLRDPLGPGVDPVHGIRPPVAAIVPEVLPTITVQHRRLGRLVTINATDYDPAVHEKVVPGVTLERA